MPLHYAAKKDYTDIVEHLVTHGASVNSIETVGQSCRCFVLIKVYLTYFQYVNDWYNQLKRKFCMFNETT